MALFMRTQLCGEITLQKLEFSLLDVFIDSFVRKPSFLPKKILQVYKLLWKSCINTFYFVTILGEWFIMNHILNVFFFFSFFLSAECLQNYHNIIAFICYSKLFDESYFFCVCGFVYSVGGDADSEIITFLPIFDWLPKSGNILLFPWLSSPYVGQVPQVHCCI